MIKQFFLPTGLVLALAAAFLAPAGGVIIAENHGVKALIFLIFLVSGFQNGPRGLPLNRGLLKIFLASAVISLLLAPLLGVLVTRAVDFTPTVALGIIIITAMPPTISSGIVITEVSRGNAVLAMFLTITLNLSAIFVIPYVLDIGLETAGTIDINRSALLLKMLLLVLLPFALGKLFRSVTGKTRVSPNWSYVNSACVILVVYSSLSGSQDVFAHANTGHYLLILFAVALLHILLLLINNQAGKLLDLGIADRKAFVFVTSQKTIAVGLAVLANINYDTGNAVIVCLMFHFFQLIADSFLAGWWQKRGKKFRKNRAGT